MSNSVLFYKQKKLSDLIDRYLADLDSEDKLDFDTALKLAQVIPKEKRQSFDTLARALLKAYEKEPHKSEERQRDLLAHIDLNKLNEKTLEELKENPSVPPKLVADAAIALCHRIRRQLEDANLLAGLNSKPSTHTHHHNLNDSSSYATTTKYKSYDCAPAAAPATYTPSTNYTCKFKSRTLNLTPLFFCLS